MNMENKCEHPQPYPDYKSFLKKNSAALPGRPTLSPDFVKDRRRMSKNLFSVPGISGVGSAGPSSFQDFQESVNDAWDTEDDEFGFVSDIKISKKVSHSAALSVINHHKSNSKDLLPQVNYKSTKKPQMISKGKESETKQKLATQSRQSKKNHSNEDVSENQFPATAVLKLENKSAFFYQKLLRFPGRPQPLKQSQSLPKYKLLIPSKQQGDDSKIDKFQSLLNTSLLNLDELRQLSWSGVPAKFRSIIWKLLSEYLPTNLERREQVLKRKRLDYWNLVKQYYDIERDEGFQDTYRQIHIDVPRMSPLIPLFQQSAVQIIFERILYIWAIRHPASGYVQGINDLVTPFFLVFLQEAIPLSSWNTIENYEVASLAKEKCDIIEADTFWCLSKFLDGIQDNYIFAQLGIQYKVNQLKELIRRVDAPLHQHFGRHGVGYLQFSFRWMNNLLTREIPLHCTIRLWDTYLAESNGFASFQLYVCAAFLLCWRKHLLLQSDFQGLMLMLQNLPTQNWSDSEIDILVAEAYKLKFTFADAPNHLQADDLR